MSTIIRKTQSWPGIEKIKHLFIFGDSYSSILFGYNARRPAIPTPSQPLGVPYPGEQGGLWTEDTNAPNWVGHFLTKYRPGPLYKHDAQQQDPEYLSSPLLVYDYAIGGNTVNHVAGAQMNSFAGGSGAKPEWAPWNAEDSLFVTWVGINDCAYSHEHKKNIDTLFESQEKLYQMGARNFVFFDVPPIQRTPAVPPAHAIGATKSFSNWNACLSEGMAAFSASHKDATVLLFSSHATFNTVLDDLEKHGLPAGDARVRGGAVWVDHIHPTSAIHEQVARYFAEFMSTVE